MNKQVLTKRIVFFIIGTTFNALGITLITKAYLGTSPISSLPFVLSLGLPPSFGVLTFVFNMIFFCRSDYFAEKRISETADFTDTGHRILRFSD